MLPALPDADIGLRLGVGARPYVGWSLAAAATAGVGSEATMTTVETPQRILSRRSKSDWSRYPAARGGRI